MKSFLVVSREQAVFNSIENFFYRKCKVDRVTNKSAALGILRRKRYDFIFIDLEILRGTEKSGDYRGALTAFWEIYPSLEIIVMSPQENIREAVKAVKAGASNYLTYPINPEEVSYVTESIYDSLIVQSELAYLRGRFWQDEALEIIRTKNPLMQEVFDKIRLVAPTKSTVLFVGETGTGKGILAQLIHKHSNRKDAPFIGVHCGAIPDTLLESELFGHEKGAFTGAVRRKLGKFEIAKGGTIFLDEVGTITPSAQITLLQVLHDGTFHRVGGEETIEANARVIAATNTDLKQMCDDGLFRRDLYYRLNVFPIEIPPLRERVEDLPSIVEVVLKRLNRFHLKEIYEVHPLVMEAFQRYPWPGNIREMENLMERAYILESSSILTPESFPREIFTSETPTTMIAVDSSLSLAEVRRKGIEHLETRYLKEVLARHNGRIKESAGVAGVSTRQLHKLMTKYRMRKEEYKLPSLGQTKRPIKV